MLYVLDENGTVVKLGHLSAINLAEGAAAFDMKNRRVAITERDGVEVSTVFLMIGATPYLWETMVFGGSMDGHQVRAETLQEAVALHQNTVRLAFSGNPPETVWGTLPTLNPDGTVGPRKIQEVVGMPFWDRLLLKESPV